MINNSSWLESDNDNMQTCDNILINYNILENHSIFYLVPKIYKN